METLVCAIFDHYLYLYFNCFIRMHAILYLLKEKMLPTMYSLCLNMYQVFTLQLSRKPQDIPKGKSDCYHRNNVYRFYCHYNTSCSSDWQLDFRVLSTRAIVWTPLKCLCRGSEQLEFLLSSVHRPLARYEMRAGLASPTTRDIVDTPTARREAITGDIEYTHS